VSSLRPVAASRPSNLLLFGHDSNLALANLIAIGSARIVANTTKLVCCAWLDAGNAMASLTVVKKGKQKGD
jgi:hypothetical protein